MKKWLSTINLGNNNLKTKIRTRIKIRTIAYKKQNVLHLGNLRHGQLTKRRVLH